MISLLWYSIYCINDITSAEISINLNLILPGSYNAIHNWFQKQKIYFKLCNCSIEIPNEMKPLVAFCYAA